MSLSGKAFRAIMLALGVSASVSSAQTNYIYNGDFSAPITTTTKMLLLNNGHDWSVSTNNIVTWDKINGHNAPGCMRIKADTVGAVKPKFDRIIAPITTTGADVYALGATKMQIKFWVRSGRADGADSKVFARFEAFLNHSPWTMVPKGFLTYPQHNKGAGKCDSVWRECVINDMPVTSNNVYNFHFLVNDTDSEILVDDITFVISETGSAATSTH
ncbi:MAG: hypothetical protein HOO88_01585 [Kiritimatiellaceae bacterium]|nr:hypothetical protein [Kiritimatiellaceae bacterium]